MKIGIAGPMTLQLLDFDFGDRPIPSGYSFPLISMIINGLIKRGFDVVAYTTSDGIEESLVFSGDKLTICIAPKHKHPGSNFFKNERMALQTLMRQYPVDIVNAQWSYEFAIAALSSGIPTVVTVHDYASAILKYQFDPYRMVRWLMNFVAIRRAKHLIAISPYILRHVDKKKARLIPNFYDKDLEKYFSRSNSKSNYLVSVSTFDKRKNVENAILAFGILRKKFPDLDYYLLGGGMEENGPAHAFALKNGLDSGIKFLGHQPFSTVIEYVSKARVLLHPAKEESFCMSALESMIIGTPVVGGKNSGNIPDLLGNGAHGLLCDVTSPNSIAKTVASLLNDTNLATSIVESANHFAKVQFSEERFFSKLIDYYASILEKKR